MTEPASLVVGNIGALVTGEAHDGDPLGVVRDAVLVADNGLVTYAGPNAGADLPRSSARTEIDARGAAVIPGFVDAHTHIAWLGDRSEEYAARAGGATYEEIARRGGGIRSTVRATAAGSVAAIADAASARALRMRDHGTTTVEIKSGYGLELGAEMRQLEAAVEVRRHADLPAVETTYLPLHSLPDGDRAALVDEVCERGIAAASTRARFCDVFCEEGAYTVDECRRVLVAARRAGLALKVHAEQRTHSGGAMLAAELGATSADHLDHASDDDLRALAATGVTGVILPGASLVLGGPPPPGGRLLEAGATVAIATDCNPGTCFSESMPLMISLAVATCGLTPAQALLAATSGGAAALGLRDRGVLRAGLRCDALVLETPNWVDVAYHLGANPVARVIRDGRVLAEWTTL